MKKISYIWLIISILLLSACKNDGQALIDLTNTRNLTPISFSETDNVKMQLAIKQISIPTQENAYINSFCEVDGIIYYTVSFFDYLEKIAMEQKDNTLRFEEKYNTQIRAFNTSSKEDRLIYKYNKDYCVLVTNLVCNGEYLVWEDYAKDSSWSINKINLGNNKVINTPKVIISQNDYPDTILGSITLTITKDYLYWYQCTPSTDKGKFNTRIDYYDFENDKVSTIMDNLFLISPYERVSIVDNVICAYSKDIDDIYVIHVYDIKANARHDIIVPTNVVAPISNGKIIIWSDTFDAKRNMYVYNLEKDEINLIQNGDDYSLLSYNILDDKVLVCNSKDADGFSNIYYYDIYGNTRSNITTNNNENISYGYMFYNYRNSIILEFSITSNSFETLYIK